MYTSYFRLPPAQVDSIEAHAKRVIVSASILGGGRVVGEEIRSRASGLQGQKRRHSLPIFTRQ